MRTETDELAEIFEESLSLGDTALLDDVLESFGTTSGMGFIICDETGTIVSSNTTAASLFSISKDQLAKGRKLADAVEARYARGDFYLGPDDKAFKRHAKKTTRAMMAGKFSTQIWRHAASNGELLEVRHIYTADKRLYITVREATEDSNKDQLLKIALKNANAGYWHYTLADNRIELSSHFQSLLTEAEKTAIADQGLWAVVHPKDVPVCKRAWQRMIKGEDLVEFSYRMKLERMGTLYFHNIGRPNKAGTNKTVSITCFVTDVTKQTVASLRIQQAKEEAERALHNNNDFLARMSHEIRTPLNGISGMADALLHGGNCTGVSDQLNVIKDSANNLLRVLTETLEHARLSTGKIEIVPEMNSPKDMLKGLHTLWQSKAESDGTKITLHMAPSLPEAFSFDRFRFEQCLNNLLSNAVKFTQHGEIKIIATLFEKPGCEPVFVTAVKDTGIGMTQEQQTHVFTPFEQADNTISERFGGTGLGMAICKDFIELMDGKISMESELGVGTTFALSLPCTKILRKSVTHEIDDKTPAHVSPSNAQALKPNTKQANTFKPNMFTDVPQTHFNPQNVNSPPSQSSPPSIINESLVIERFKMLSVLVVEDNPTNQLVIKALLKPLVREVSFAENGALALSTLKTQPVDLIFMDIHMPVMDGIETTLAIRSDKADWSNVHIVALTADPEYQQQRICKNIGMNGAIAKPVSRRKITEALYAALEAKEVTLASAALSRHAG